MEQKSNFNVKPDVTTDGTIITSLEKKVSFKSKMKSIVLPTAIILLAIGVVTALVFIIRVTN